LKKNKECPECQGTGWVLDEHKGRYVARRCRCFGEKRRETLLERSNIPRRYRDCTLENFYAQNASQKDALKISMKFVHDYPELKFGLLYQGPCGVGKTHLAVALLNELMTKRDASCYFVDFRELIRSIQSTYTADSALNEQDVLAPVFNSDVVVLDELGAKRTTSWVEETVFYIINQRYNAQKLTVFTSNYLDQGEEDEDLRDTHFKKEEDALVDRIGIRLRSRIYEMCKIVNVDGPDYRKTIKQANYRF
jgi:DNA replication protein DnaC